MGVSGEQAPGLGLLVPNVAELAGEIAAVGGGEHEQAFYSSNFTLQLCQVWYHWIEPAMSLVLQELARPRSWTSCLAARLLGEWRGRSGYVDALHGRVRHFYLHGRVCHFWTCFAGLCTGLHVRKDNQFPQSLLHNRLYALWCFDMMTCLLGFMQCVCAGWRLPQGAAHLCSRVRLCRTVRRSFSQGKAFWGP